VWYIDGMWIKAVVVGLEFVKEEALSCELIFKKSRSTLVLVIISGGVALSI